jgi:hypothetical protein
MLRLSPSELTSHLNIFLTIIIDQAMLAGSYYPQIVFFVLAEASKAVKHF